MRKLLLGGWVLLASAALPAAGQELLPPSFSGWSAPAASVSYRADALEQWVGADAAIFGEYGALSAERRIYSRGHDTLTATLYRMRDTTGSYGLYTYLLAEPMSPAGLTAHSALARQRALATVGNLLLDVTGSDLQLLKVDLKALVARLTAADRSPFPTLELHFPAQGRVPNSERYLLGPVALQRLLPLGNGDWLGFADGAEAVLARFRVGKQQATLLLAAYPTPQSAARKLEELGRWFPLNPAQDSAANSPAPLFARRKGSLVMLVVNTRSHSLANTLLEQVRYETQVTWNEPRQSLTDPNIAQILVGTIIGTGVILFFALVAGIGFGGVRILVKYFFPGKVFDRTSQVEILQLGLSSKPIEAKDFY